VRSGFPWGIQDVDFGVVYDAAYQNFVLNTFQASAVAQGNSGWPSTESGPNQTDYSSYERFITWAQGANLSVWGPQVTWDDTNNGIPLWVQQQVSNGGNLDQLIAVRSTNAMVSGAGRFVTVTVDNEGLHNSYIPRNGNGTDSIIKCFTTTRTADLAIGHNTPITFNEYNVGESCYYNFPMKYGGDPVSPDDFIARVNFLNSQGSGQLVNVAGLQFQITPNELEAQRMSIAIDYIHNRTGLPIHITEFNVNTKFDTYPFDRTYQADILEVSLRQLFANPNVQAILMQHIIPYPYGGDSDAMCGPCIFASGTYTPNVAGIRYLKLREEWSTRVSGATVDANGNTAQLRLYHGTYTVTFNDSNGNASPAQLVTVNNDNGTYTTQYVTVNV
jgi:GH35 family endo-1,4-beta-xylanase